MTTETKRKVWDRRLGQFRLVDFRNGEDPLSHRAIAIAEVEQGFPMPKLPAGTEVAARRGAQPPRSPFGGGNAVATCPDPADFSKLEDSETCDHDQDDVADVLRGSGIVMLRGRAWDG